MDNNFVHNMDNPQMFFHSNALEDKLYTINGDDLSANNKHDAKYRINELYKLGYYDKTMRDILLEQLKALP